MKHILIVEDDITMNKMIVNLLKSEEHKETPSYNIGVSNSLHENQRFEYSLKIDSAYTFNEAKENLAKKSYDLAILDINLPDGSGYEVCEIIKRNKSNTAVIFLTANDLEMDMIKGYELGAVDYITKPFSNAVLCHKIKAVFTLLENFQSNKPTHKIFDDGHLYIDFSSLIAMHDGKGISLAPLEYRVLEVFVDNKGILLTRQKLFEKLWDSNENYIEEHTLTATISRIRGKIEKGGKKYIQTVYGMGYMFISDLG